MIKKLENGKTSKKNLVLFIHGLTGNEETWSNVNGTSFPELLFHNNIVKRSFDIGYFDYYSKIFTSLHNIIVK